MYDVYKHDPNSVHASWRAYFSNIEEGHKDPFQPAPFVSGGTEASNSMLSIRDTIKVYTMARAYQIRGHEIAKTDPLELNKNVAGATVDNFPEGLDPAYFGFTTADLDREFRVGTDIISGVLGGSSGNSGVWKLRDLLAKLNSIYTEYVGFEYMHISNRIEKNWLRDRIEVQRPIEYSKGQKTKVFELLSKATLLEEFLHTKFQTHKRFGLDGLEGLIPGLSALIEQSVINGVETIVIGTAHRGRLNMLANVLDFSLNSLFDQFLGSAVRTLEGGDVKYHLGTTCVREIAGKKVTIMMLPNPSHLETVDAVAMGHVRAHQFFTKDPMKVLGILIHGDAALAGQGIVYETVQM
jgi:2-oxoglutarate dehydrogenase E1 component